MEIHGNQRYAAWNKMIMMMMKGIVFSIIKMKDIVFTILFYNLLKAETNSHVNWIPKYNGNFTAFPVPRFNS